MKTQEIRELIKVVEQSDIDELEVSRWGHRIRITKNKNHVADSQPQQITIPAQPSANTQSAPASQPEPKVEEPAETPEEASPADSGPTDNFEEVKSPIVGTFYRSPSPESDPFVGVGDTVKPGQTLCIVEAMKIMNEIECETSGVVKEIVAEDSQPVEYNQTLFLIEPK
ncbi:MAG: acetyl-CoA carboxylase biotin carboxyl carrier protein [Candidatus Marinimicrobia bacterium]|nr:acetyl-CoA carboxylase biotin carboxyl carrier protein [Candidatus Neomarinimicrobiota bacterium]MCF7827505.1 acetyl-CoA carboxylase biotin carboxyl carrier protein [Candidatus Neomarinimicrobiota bacterium]MCF7881633.1 acetyl-CoA carboxylase biotin carboxyl carrier protein [Candidatus Neomarinimicrobiota bacterium]